MSNTPKRPHVRVGTIGHVDHGKTALTAALSMLAKHAPKALQVQALPAPVVQCAQAPEIGPDYRAHDRFRDTTPQPRFKRPPSKGKKKR